MARGFAGSDYITVPSGSNWTGTMPASVSLWFYPTAASGYAGLFIGGLLLYWLGSRKFAVYGWSGYDPVSMTALTLSNWYHVLLTAAPNATYANITMYLNGSVLYNAPNGGTAGATGGFYLGSDVPNNPRYLQGSMADVAIWKAALTQDEATALASGARPSQIQPASLTFWMPLDGLSSPETDLGGKARNGVLTGTSFAAGPPVNMFTRRWPRNYDPVAATVPLSQTHFRFRTDTNAVDATPTWGANEDTDGYNPDTNKFRIRFKIEKVEAA